MQPRNKFGFACSCSLQNNVQLWHNRLGHPNFKVLLYLIKLIKSSLINVQFVSHQFQSILQQSIISQQTCPHTLQQNGVAERKNQHLLDMVRCLLLESSVPPRFLLETLTTVVYLINHLLSSTRRNQTPYYRLFKSRIWVCLFCPPSSI